MLSVSFILNLQLYMDDKHFDTNRDIELSINKEFRYHKINGLLFSIYT